VVGPIDGRLTGKIAVITGSAGGIGASAAELFSGAGAKVVLTDRNGPLLERAVDEIRQHVPQADVRGVVCDVARYDEAKRVVDAAVEAYGGLDVLVCNAAVRHEGTVEQTTVEDWQRIMDTNVIGAANFCRAAFASLRRSGSASVVIVSSCYAVIGRKEMPIYDASKAALLSLMKSVAWDGAADNVRANAVCPGGTITPYTLALGEKIGKTEAEMRAERKANSLLGRRASAEEIAYPILWLASDEASYMTGATLMVDGGLSIM